jgi:hypothetical protein
MMNGKQVSLKQQARARAELAAQNNWGLQEVLKRRRALMRSVPIMSEEITKIDEWLITQDGLPVKVWMDIWSRTIFVELMPYEEQSPEVKHIMMFRFLQRYSRPRTPKLQKKLEPFLARWWELVREECNGSA